MDSSQSIPVPAGNEGVKAKSEGLLVTGMGVGCVSLEPDPDAVVGDAIDGDIGSHVVLAILFVVMDQRVPPRRLMEPDFDPVDLHPGEDRIARSRGQRRRAAKEKREERGLEKLLGQLERHQLLVLDELGYVPFTKSGAELLFEVVSRAYERTSLIVTTNLPFEQWTEVMGSERLTGALLDRLTHHVHILEANGESYRLKESKGWTDRASTGRVKKES